MTGEQHVRPVGDEQPAVEADATLVEPGELGEQGVRRHHHAVAEDAHHAGVQDARRDELQGEVAVAELHRVAGVVAALVAHHAVEGGTEEIDDLPLALVPPLHPHDDDVGHVPSSSKLLHL